MTGFTRESVLSSFGSARRLVASIREGRIRGVVAMVGCTTPKVAHESSHVTIARELIKNGVLVLTSGCSAHALLNAGLCSPEAAEDAAPGLREACEAAGVPPALAVGGCSDNARIIQVFAWLAHEAQTDFPDMPFVVSGPEFANEKTMGQMMGVLAHGITTVVGLTPSLPIPAVGPTARASDPGGMANRNSMVDFFEGDGLHSIVGSRLFVRPDPLDAACTIIEQLDCKREALGWEPAGEATERAVV
jgi:carbon-monoxide dehydrogenase catalytic subunit